MCVCVFEFRQFFFTLGFRLRIDLCKKSDRTRCLAVSILEYNINSNSKSAEFGFLKEERNSVVIRLVNIVKKNEEIAQNHIAVFSTHFYHILTCIYTVFFMIKSTF